MYSEIKPFFKVNPDTFTCPFCNSRHWIDFKGSLYDYLDTFVIVCPNSLTPQGFGEEFSLIFLPIKKVINYL